MNHDQERFTGYSGPFGHPHDLGSDRGRGGFSIFHPKQPSKFLVTVGHFALIWVIFSHFSAAFLDKFWTFFQFCDTFWDFSDLFLALLEPFFDLLHLFKLPKIAFCTDLAHFQAFF